MGKNYNYVFLFYDVGEKRVNKVFKICKKYLTHIQKSVFEGNLTELDLMKLKSELDSYIRKDKDSLIIFKSRNERWLEKEFLGIEDDKTSNFF